ncbi:MAG: biopolymer transporter ExbD [Myxococcota bacterium]
MAQGTQRPGGIIEGINVTPLVDIALVLLIIFIVTAKIVVAPAVPMDLPEASQAEEIQTIFAVGVDATGALTVDGQPCADDALDDLAQGALERDGELRAVIQADGAVPHRRVIEVLDVLKVAGIERVAFGALRTEGIDDEGEEPETDTL